MKKIMTLLLIIISLHSIVFAKEENQTKEDEYNAKVMQQLKDCQLNLDRWVYVSVLDGSLDAITFFDSQTIVKPLPDTMDVWVCVFLTGKESCEASTCVEKKMDVTKHYHLYRWRFDLSTLKMTLLSVAIRDIKMNLVDSLEYPIKYQITKTVTPDSVGEGIMKAAKEIVDKKNK